MFSVFFLSFCCIHKQNPIYLQHFKRYTAKHLLYLCWKSLMDHFLKHICPIKWVCGAYLIFAIVVYHFGWFNFCNNHNVEMCWNEKWMRHFGLRKYFKILKWISTIKIYTFENHIWHFIWIMAYPKLILYVLSTWETILETSCIK